MAEVNMVMDASKTPGPGKKKAGRPAGSKNKPKPPEKRKFDPDSMPIIWKCSRCGMVTDHPIGKFYTSKMSALYVGNDGYTTLCSACAKTFYEEQLIRYKDEQIALIATCCALDIYYSEQAYFSIRDRNEVTIASYVKQLNLIRKNLPFSTYLIEMLLTKGALTEENLIREDFETKWTPADRKNKGYVISTVGYDCFDDESYTDENRKFLFNTLAAYLTDEVAEDPHRMQCVVALVKVMLQQEQIDRAISAEMRRNNPDYGEIMRFSKIKDSIVSTISRIANDNGISAKSSGKSGRSSTALTSIMKEMLDTGFDEIKANVIEAKQSKSYKEIADQNARALMNELALTSDEYAAMLAEQSALVRRQAEELEAVKEELRLLKLEAKTEAAKKGRRS